MIGQIEAFKAQFQDPRLGKVEIFLDRRVEIYQTSERRMIERTIVMMAEKILITKVVAKQKDRVLHGECRTRTLNIKHEPARPGKP
jgi:hypothetical protein